MMKKIVTAFVLLGLVAVSGLQAQQNQASDSLATITANITDAEGSPLSDVLVKTFRAGDQAFTDSEGSFTITALTAGDRLIIDQRGYKLKVVPVIEGQISQQTIVLETNYRIEGDNQVNLPYNTISSDRSVSAVSSISGEELQTYPTGNLLEALTGRVPGLVVYPGSSMPGQESVFISIRGEAASVYVDGIERTANDLSAEEVDQIQVFKDMSARTALGVSGAGPVIWITTRKGRPNSSEMNISTELGVNAPTVLPHHHIF